MAGVRVRLQKGILWLILDRPPLNALTVEMLDQLTTALHKAISELPRLIVLTGTGEQAFCSGVDLLDDTEGSRLDLLRAARNTETAFELLHKQGFPTVAVVKGIAYGAGCELVALCDTVIARDDARFRLPALNAKIFPSVVSIYLPASIGHENTTHLMQSGQTQDARQALQLGLVHQVLPNRRFLIDTEELLVMLATHR
jgi:enoyl-CoA hydratase/carnithine racemase